MSLIVTSDARAETLSRIIDAAQSGSRHVAAPTGDSLGGDLKLVRVKTEWSASARSTDAGGSGVATAIELWPDDAGTDPSAASGNLFAITALVSPTEIECSGIAARVVAGTDITIVGTSYDDGDAHVTAVSTTGGTSRLTLDRALQMSSASGSVLLPGAYQRVLAPRSVTPISRERHDVGLVARAGGEWHMLTAPEAWVMLDADLVAATVSSAKIAYSTARATVLIDDGSGLVESDQQLNVSNADESMVAAENTLLRVRLCGSRWFVLWTGCVPSRLRS